MRFPQILGHIPSGYSNYGHTIKHYSDKVSEIKWVEKLYQLQSTINVF